MDRTLIERYAEGGRTLTDSIAGLSREELNRWPIAGAEGAWSIQQIVMHLLDSDLIASDRMKRIIAEDSPTLIGYDETRFAEHLHYSEMDARVAGEIFRLNRELTAELLRRLPDSAFNRIGQHNERGPISLAELVSGYVKHLDHHLTFLRDKRRRLGKAL